MKVAHIFWGLGFGGIETMLVNIANAQAEYGADVHIVLINELYEISLLNRLNPKVKVHILNRKLGSKGLGFIWRLNNELKAINPNKIHLHGPEFYAMIFDSKFRLKTSLTLHDLPISPVRRYGFLRSCLSKLTLGLKCGEEFVTQIPKVFAISESVKDAFYAKYGITSQVVLNGILTSIFKKKKYEKNTPYRVIQISRLNYKKKGQDLLIKAISVAKGKIDVTFIGDGEDLDYLKGLTKELRLEEYVHFVGKQSQNYIANHLRDFDLFVQPSRREGFGLTVAEAMAAKVPVLVSSGQGPAEVTEKDKFGWVFENGSVQDLADQIMYVFKHYDEAYVKAEQACEHVRLNYDVAITAKRYLELY